jgi:hypothetical protein
MGITNSISSPLFSLPIYTYLFISTVGVKQYRRWQRGAAYVAVWTIFATTISLTSQGIAQYFDPSLKQSDENSALALVRSSLILQLALNGPAGCLLLIQWLQNRAPEAGEDMPEASPPRKGPSLVLSLFLLNALITVRNVFRTIQIFSSPNSAIWTEEAYYWVFDACIMLCYTVSFHILHPGKIGVYKTDGCNHAQPEC